MRTQNWVGNKKTWTLRRYKYPGKYEGGLSVDEVTHSFTMDGCTESFGDVTDYGVFYSRLTAPVLTPDFLLQVQDHLTLEEIDFLFAVGAIIEETDSGFVYVTYYDEPYDLEAAWSKLEDKYEQWSEEVAE